MCGFKANNMKELIQEIKEHFATGLNGLRKIFILPEPYSAYTYRNAGVYGLAIEFPNEVEINESANEVVFSTQTILKESGEQKFLLLTCLDEEYRNEFAELSCSFVEPGTNGEKREALLKDPLSWWNRWTELLGDRKSKKGSYDVLAELMALDYLYKQDKTVRWAASEEGTHDIESQNHSYEVKSTVKKSESHITISSRFQLESVNELSLFFFRLECSEAGFSINDVVESLVKHGYDRNLIESQLGEKGLVKGRSTRGIKYTVLEARWFDVDEKFPKIVEKSFKNNTFPQNIIKILYTIDLEGLDYSSMHFIKNSDGTISVEIGDTHKATVTTKIPIYPRIQPNCVPLYSLRAACGIFTSAEQPSETGWVDVSGHGFTPDKDKYFVVHATGDSMLPKIKDGDLCVFEWYNERGGTREGDIVLIWSEEKLSDGSTYTIKKYHSIKEPDGDSWMHKRIILKPLNPDFKPIELEEGQKVNTIGILKCVL
jgi:SOS-response transcriptional repressor LexA